MTVKKQEHRTTHVCKQAAFCVTDITFRPGRANLHLFKIFCLNEVCIFYSSALGNLKGRLRRLQASEAALQPTKESMRQCCRRDSGGNIEYCQQSSAVATGSCCCAAGAEDLADQLSNRSRLLSAALPSYSPLLTQERQHMLPG